MEISKHKTLDPHQRIAKENQVRHSYTGSNSFKSLMIYNSNALLSLDSGDFILNA